MREGQLKRETESYCVIFERSDLCTMNLVLFCNILCAGPILSTAPLIVSLAAYSSMAFEVHGRRTVVLFFKDRDHFQNVEHPIRYSQEVLYSNLKNGSLNSLMAPA